MIQAARHDQILRYLTDHELLTVEEAADRFGSSPATVRRDFNLLAEKNLVERVRGGVKLASASSIVPYNQRTTQLSAEKKAIAAAAAKLLEPHQVVIVDGGTTTTHLRACLPNFPLHLITNSVHLAAELDEDQADRSNVEVFLTGGFLYPKSGLLLGPGAQSTLSQYHADWAFLSVGGINAEGVSNTNELIGELERVMIANARRVAVLADHSKIDHRAMCQVCSLSEIDLLITDENEDTRTSLDAIRARGVEVVEVSSHTSN